MSFFRKKKKEPAIPKNWKITQNCLDLILECAKSNYPNEFGGLLRVDTVSKDTITEIIILPGTVSGESHAIFKMHMAPVDFLIVGTVHSHPSPSANPSDADLQFFGKNGRVHIIAAKPYTDKTWKAYDQIGKEIFLRIV